MPELKDYIEKLLDMREKDPVKYAETMKNYQDNYSTFYSQLINAMPKEEVAGVEGKKKLVLPKYNFKNRLMDFLRAFWFYLILISGGLITVVILLIILFSRLT